MSDVHGGHYTGAIVLTACFVLVGVAFVGDGEPQFQIVNDEDIKCVDNMDRQAVAEDQVKELGEEVSIKILNASNDFYAVVGVETGDFIIVEERENQACGRALGTKEIPEDIVQRLGI